MSEMIKQIIKTENAPKAIGPYSQGFIYGDLVFTSGQIPIDPATGELVENDIEKQALMVMANLKAVLEAAESSLDNIIKTTCFLTSMDDFAIFNSVYAQFINAKLPARSCVAVKELPKGSLCEVEAIAFLKNN